MSKEPNQDYLYKKCDSCGKDHTKVYAVNSLKSKDTLHHVKVKCRNCGLVYSNPQATEGKIKEFYSNIYPEILGTIKVIDDETFFLDPHNRMKQMKPGRFLDVGCAYGFRLKTAERLGWEAHGVEVSKHFCDYAKNVLGLRNIFEGTLFNARYETSCFDYVVLWHVLEHVPDPSNLLKEIERILKTGGILLIGVPNIMEPIYQITRIGCLLKGKPFPMATSDQHTYEFTPATLSKMVSKCCPTLAVGKVQLYYLKSELISLSKMKINMNWKGRLQINIARFLDFILKNRIGNLISLRCVKK